MNKELIKKYKKEFDHYINGGTVLAKYPKLQDEEASEWLEDDTVFDNLEEALIVINDKFVEIRKAIVEGRQVQFKNSTEWKDISFLTIRPEETPDMYRIKPTIKVGDWLFDVQYKTYHRVSRVLSDRVELNEFNILLSVIDGYNYEIWKPKIGEFCIMELEQANHSAFVVQKWEENAKWTPIPYTGPIPYYTKD